MEALKTGDVVYLRGDVALETPMTVKAFQHDMTDMAVAVVWLAADKCLTSWFGPRECFMTEAERAVDLDRLMEEKRRAIERSRIRKPYDGGPL